MEVVNVCFDLLRSNLGSTEVFYYCLAYMKCVNVDQLSTPSRHAWATLLFETLTTFLGVAPIVSDALDILGHLYGGGSNGGEQLPALNFAGVQDAILVLMDNGDVVKAGLSTIRNLNGAYDDAVFTVLILVLYVFYDNESLSATALELLHTRLTGTHDWTGYEVDAVMGTLTTFADSYVVQRSGTIILSHLCQHYPLLCRERYEQLVPFLMLVEETFAGNDLSGMARIMLAELKAR
jgi:hypothetical protein